MKKVIDLYKSSYTGLAPSSWWLSVVMLINRSGTMVVPFMTLYLTQSLGYSIGKASLVMALFGMGAVCGGFIGGWLSDRFGFYRIQLLTLAGGGLLFLILGQMRSFPLICAFTFILSLVNESFRPANSLAIAHYSSEENRTRSYSLNRLAINLGWSLGGAVGGFIAARNYHLLFVIDGCTNILAAVMLRLFLKPAGHRKAGEKEQTLLAPRFTAFRDRAYMVFSFLVVLYAYCFFQLFSTLPVYFRQVMHLTEEKIGITMTVNGLLIALFEMVLVFKLEGKRPPLHYIKYGTALIGISFLLFNMFPGGMWLAMTSTLIITLGEMLSMPFMNTYWISRSGEASRGQYAGLYTVSWAMAQVLGPGTGGQLADRFGFTVLWWIIGGICALSAIGFWLLQLKSSTPDVSEREDLEAAAKVYVAVEEDRGGG